MDRTRADNSCFLLVESALLSEESRGWGVQQYMLPFKVDMVVEGTNIQHARRVVLREATGTPVPHLCIEHTALACENEEACPNDTPCILPECESVPQ